MPGMEGNLIFRTFFFSVSVVFNDSERETFVIKEGLNEPVMNVYVDVEQQPVMEPVDSFNKRNSVLIHSVPAPRKVEPDLCLSPFGAVWLFHLFSLTSLMPAGLSHFCPVGLTGYCPDIRLAYSSTPKKLSE